jgi:hypothetical protein
LKVKVLYILNCGMDGADDSESNEVSRGLFLKYQERTQAAGVVLLKNKKLVLSQLLIKGSLPLNWAVEGRDPMDIHDAQSLLAGLPSAPEGAERSIGVYVVMHGPGTLAVEAHLLAGWLNNMLPPDANSKLHYVVLVACKMVEETLGEVMLDAKDGTYITRFMAAMSDLKMKPVTVGWDVFISAAPHQPTERNGANRVTRSVYKQGTNEKVADLKSIAGSKILKDEDDKKYSTVSNSYRMLHKHLYQIVNGKLSVKRATWSTRND